MMLQNPKPGTAAAEGKRDEKAIMQDISAVYCHLSPENLTCDGELSRSQVNARRAELNRKLRQLFAELGRSVTEDEAYERTSR